MASMYPPSLDIEIFAETEQLERVLETFSTLLYRLAQNIDVALKDLKEIREQTTN